MKEVDLYCSDGALCTAIAKFSKKKWSIFGISEVHGFGNAEYKKKLFKTTFDDIIAFNSMSGIAYVAVKKANLWGLIRFRQNPKSAFNKEFFEKAIGNEPIDEKAMDPIGREIKLIEDIKYPDIDTFKDKYQLDNLYKPYSSIEDKKLHEIPRIKSEWSDTAIEGTKDVLLNLNFGSPTVRMKRIDGSLGFIPLADALSYKINIHNDEDGNIYHYENINEMIEDGWVVD
jgi:hypothetical protein